MRHRIYLTPGMFGFGKLATYDYFAHVARALRTRFEAAGQRVDTYVVDVAPTASIRRRAGRLAELVASTSSEDSHVHLLGHSTGGLDARLVASPSARLPVDPARLLWLPRLRSVTTMNTPHYGTPLASFFATVSGQRMLYAVSALTFIGLSLGAPPLAAASALVVAIGQLDRAVLGMEIKVIERITDGLMKALEPASSREVRDFLDAIAKDQGAVIQLTPEAMDLFQAGVEDRPHVAYQSTCSFGPSPSVRRLLGSMRSPWRAISSTLFTTLYGITSRRDERYPCEANDPGGPRATDAALRQAFGEVPGQRANDGVVPLRSQVWGKIVWAGSGDHLDVLGHFAGFTTPKLGMWSRVRDRFRGGSAATEAVVEEASKVGGMAPPPHADEVHVDWLMSGSGFDEKAFDGLMNAIARGMLASTR